MDSFDETERETIEKVTWSGRIVSVQPRIRLMRSFDQRHHGYQGYVLRVTGVCGGIDGEFIIAVGAGAHAKHQFCTGMELSGCSVPVADPRTETAAYYKTSGLKVLQASEIKTSSQPPFLGIPPSLEIYRSRGHRRLDPRTYEAACLTCIWGCRMPVELIIDQWNPAKKQYRFETFCYGPKSCPAYQPGATRKVPGRKGMMWEEEDWVDEEATAHRGPDE
ncbi:MAG TPA: hypothetical protein PLL10_03985 [Elusimicrobiales bacterium]|nr:hypothetical protein [Elusimicrobiales bacterium]